MEMYVQARNMQWESVCQSPRVQARAGLLSELIVPESTHIGSFTRLSNKLFDSRFEPTSNSN